MLLIWVWQCATRTTAPPTRTAPPPPRKVRATRRITIIGIVIIIIIIIRYERLVAWFPALAESVALRHYVAGLSTYTPDGRYLLGAPPPLRRRRAAGGEEEVRRFATTRGAREDLVSL